MEAWKNKRKDWTTARDKKEHAVKQGAVSGVSMGDAIANVYEKSKKGFTSLSAAVLKLQAAITKYKGAISKTKPVFVKWIEANLEKQTKELLADINLDEKRLREFAIMAGQLKGPYSGVLGAANAAHVMARINHPNFQTEWKDKPEVEQLQEAMLIERYSSPYGALEKQLTAFSTFQRSRKDNGKRTLPGLADVQASLCKSADDLSGIAKEINATLQAKTFDEFRDKAKISQGNVLVIGTVLAQIHEALQKLQG